jgi:branched-chain amino acid transport system ATP-binding protein
VLLSEQNLHFARLVSDRACVLEKGAIRWEGGMEALMAAEDVRAQYLTL